MLAALAVLMYPHGFTHFGGGYFGGAATSKLLKSSASEPLGRQESVSARTLASANSQGNTGHDHWQVRQLRDLCHAGVRRPVIRPARVVHGHLRGTMPVVRLDESDGNSGLHPLRSSLRHKTLGAILRRESTPGHWVFDSDIFAHGSRVMPSWDCGYTRKVQQVLRESFGGCAWRSPVERLRLLYTHAEAKVSDTNHVGGVSGVGGVSFGLTPQLARVCTYGRVYA